MKCRICDRESIKADLCTYHKWADERLRVSFDGWSRAYGSISWAQYLEKIIKLPETGRWAKEVAEYESRKDTS